MNILKKGDFLLVGIIILAVAAAFLGTNFFSRGSDNSHRIAVVKQNDKEIQRIDLDTVDQPFKITLGGQYNETIAVEKGRIRFEEANCPDKVCVKTGWLTKKGQSSACIPNRAIIIIEGQSGKVDGTAY